MATFAAIAYSQSTGKAGIAWSSPYRASAEQQALAACPAPDAKVVIWVQDGWCALAVGDRNGYATAWGPSSEQVQRAALSDCGKVTANSKITVLLHSEQGQVTPGAACPHVEVQVNDEYLNVACPYCNQAGEFYRGAAERGDSILCGCGRQYTVRKPLPPKGPITLACPHCNQQLTVQRADVDRGDTFSCSCQGQFTVGVVEEAPISGSRYKFRHGGFDDPEPSAPAMPFVQVPCRACGQTGWLGLVGKDVCRYCGGKGWILAPSGS